MHECGSSITPLHEHAAERVVVCILGADDRTEILDTIQSVEIYGLAVHVGVKKTRPILNNEPKVTQHLIDWTGDFAWARNQLLDHVQADYVLWLDSDERLFSFPELFPIELDAVYAIRYQSDSSSTPLDLLRMHRVDAAIRWNNSVHEQLTVDGKAPLNARTLHGAIIVHSGYENPAIVHSKAQRNLRSVQASALLEALTYGELLAVARHETQSGNYNFLTWHKVFCHPQIQPEGLSFDRRFEAAYMLCCAGDDRFARKLLRLNPLIVPLRLATLTHAWREYRIWNGDEFNFLLQTLKNAFFDGRYPFPIALLACDRKTLADYLQSLAESWQTGDPIMPSPIYELDSLCRYVREPEALREPLDEDVVVMHPDSLKVVILNPVAAVLWDALCWPVTIEELTELLHEALPEEDHAKLSDHTRETLGHLLANRLIVPANSVLAE